VVILRGGVEIGEPLPVVLDLVERFRPFAVDEDPQPFSIGMADLRLANRGGARIAGVESAAILGHREAIDRALSKIAPGASLATGAVPWPALQELFDAFAEIKGVGLSKMTKTLHPKRRALIPMLDSVVQRYLHDDVLDAPFGERALALVHGYKRDLDLNRVALRTLRRQLAAHGHELTEVRILDLAIWSAFA
jgi:Family of unknown function (DUF6308)